MFNWFDISLRFVKACLRFCSKLELVQAFFFLILPIMAFVLVLSLARSDLLPMLVARLSATLGSKGAPDLLFFSISVISKDLVSAP